MKNLFKSESKDSEGDSSSSRKSSVAELVGGMKNISQALILKEDHEYQTKTKIKHSSFTNYLHENDVTTQAASHLHEAERESPKQEITTKIPLSPNYPRDQLKEATSEVDEEERKNSAMLLIDSMKDISQKIILENQNDDEASLLSQIDAELKEDKKQKGTKNSSNFVYIFKQHSTKISK